MMWFVLGLLVGIAVGFALGGWTVVALYDEARRIHGNDPSDLT